MKKFIKNILLFSLVVIVILAIQFVYSYHQGKNEIVKISTKNIIIGDSNTRWSMDDKIIKGYSNFSTGGETYLFAETKLSVLTKHNEIDTLLLYFSPHNLINNRWWNDDETIPINNRMPAFYKDFTYENHVDLLKATPKNYLKSLTKIGKEKIESLFSFKLSRDENPLFRFGFYLPNKKNETEFPIQPYVYQKPIFTEMEVKYLQKIIKECHEKNIKLILIQPPKNYLRKDYKNYEHKEFYEFYDKYLNDIDFLDFSKLKLPKYAYWDMNHVSIVGAEFFSNFIAKNGIKNLLTSQYNRKNLHQ